MVGLLKKLVIFLSNTKNFWYNRLIFKYKKVNCSDFPRIYGEIFIRNQGSISIGKNVSFNSGPYANPIGGDTRMTLIVGKSAILNIGNGTGISNSTVICLENISIGNNVKIGGSVKIYDTDFHSLDPENRKIKEKDIPKTKPVVINDNSFIGAHSIILKGVTIGENSIIGAGSVVTKSVPSGEIWAGNPAKFIRSIPNSKDKLT
ncbi:acyltransferase [Kriegella aquimaris]|uniref:Hexapeptide repeat of succinyl-transferase n=1 Tax=Kriegella aquimaris TaxID=192904 RepID=A0A1G9JSA5_9FLAO|nr:acyltransferase [Kriegella aquimaris]SDL40262.1 Hexapeptide repeat of succinyl-transferase [Kriegella aquimaris]